ncbi:MAG TPA: ABC transporter ATP-binding protein [archaeon]|nr:ABC transporter ATP-binding protein [archaeon]
MNETVLEIENYSLYGGRKQILKDVSLTVRRSDYLSIIGPNGAGKTTLLRCLTRILTGGKGRITLCGRKLESYGQKELARLVSYVPQLDGRILPFTVEEFVSMGRYPYLSPFSSLTDEDKTIVRRILEMTSTARFADHRMVTLSGGERQKVFIAAALAQGADILLLDEPTSFLDYKHQVEITGLLETLNRADGKTILAVTHDINNAVLSCNRILALKDGAVVFQGTAGELMRKDLLESIYDTAFLFIDHPQEGLPIIRPQERGL